MMFSSTILRRCLAAALLTASPLAPAVAQTLRVGIRAQALTADPASSFNPDRNISLQVYEPLLLQSAQITPEPGLAVTWSTRDPTTWVFKLRPGVVFQDGTPLTSADVVFTYNRVMSVDVTQSFRANLRDVTSTEAEGPDTVVVHTRSPAPTLPFDMATIPIVSAHAVEGAAPEDFNAGRAAVGTGPFRLVKWVPGQVAVLERNQRYWGTKPQWARAELNFISNDSSRVAALISGDLDLVDALPAELLDRVQTGGRTRVQSTTGILMLYLQPDIGRPRTPYATDANDQVLAKNPLQDLRVRQAISAAINRPALAQRAMLGTGEPAGQLMAPGLDNHLDSLAPPSFDPVRARALLAEAGYPQGFGLTVSCSNDRYAGDARICQALGQMLAAVGIRAKVDAMPMSILFRRRAGGGPDGKMDLSLYMIAYGPPNGLATAALSSLAETQNRVEGRGGNNFSGFSNPVLDKLIHQSEQELDDARRTALTAQATRMAVADLPFIPLLFTRLSWGMRHDLAMTPRADGATFAAQVRSAK
jgi:peptide/nickel transport system substrate-binding protein